MKECPACRRCYFDDVLSCPNDGEVTFSSIAGDPIFDGRYQLEKRLGQGGMGVVFKARHNFLKTAHAIKIILPDLVGNDPMLVTRFRQEALAAAAIRHPNIIAVTDFGVARGTMPFLVMEFVQGRSLQDILTAEGPLSPSVALEIMRAICAGMTAAHRQNIIHRDLKPMNIMLQDELPIAEAVKILDFGLAKIKSGELLGSFVQAQTTGMMGSPYYMAPEQWSDEEPDVRADVYSLGVILYQMLCGEVPFRGVSIPSVMKKHLTAAPAPFSSFGINVSREVEAVVLHALEKFADNRPQTVDAFIEELSLAVGEQGTLALAGQPVFLLPEARVDNLEGAAPPESINNEFKTLEVELLPSSPRFEPPVDDDLKVHTLPGSVLPEQDEEQESIDDSSMEFEDQITFHLNKDKQSTGDSEPLMESAIILRHSEFHQGEEHIFEELILHENYERLWRSLIHAKGGCNLLTGYGPFGGTSLVRCAVVKARAELQRFEGSEAALLVFHFRIKNETKESFEIEATKFGLGYLNRPAEVGYNSDLEALRMRAEQGQSGFESSVLELELDQPIGATFFRPSSMATQMGAERPDYDFSNLLADLNLFFKQNRNANELRRIVLRLIKSKFLPSRVVFILDRIGHLETLEKLAESEFFSNRRIRVVAVSREEDFDCWKNAGTRLEKIGFSKWYVPCLWKINNSEVLFKLTSQEDTEPNKPFNIFLKHLEYKGRGSLGHIFSALRRSVNIRYENKFSYINPEDLKKSTDIQHNAWIQDVLDMNWTTILGDLFGGIEQDKKTDRARIGIYYLIDWIAHEGPFSKADILEVAGKTRITISDHTGTRADAIDRLLFVLVQNKYLSCWDDTYRVIWNKNSMPTCRSVKYKRRNSARRQEKASGSPDNSTTQAAATSPVTTTSSSPVKEQAQPNSHTPEQTPSQPSHADLSSTTVILTQSNDDMQSSNLEYSVNGSKTAQSKKVFISYSHADKKWLKRLQLHLKLIEREGLIELWDDSRIKTGDNWREEIKNAISSAKIAILLVSVDFLASDFIANDELPPLLAASRTEGTEILPLIVGPCMFKKTNLSQFQAFNDPSTPLSAMTTHQREKLFLEAAEFITQVIYQ